MIIFVKDMSDISVVIKRKKLKNILKKFDKSDKVPYLC